MMPIVEDAPKIVATSETATVPPDDADRRRCPEDRGDQ
jgi:hypothetical protein